MIPILQLKQQGFKIGKRVYKKFLIGLNGWQAMCTGNFWSKEYLVKEVFSLIYTHEPLLLTDDEQTVVHIGWEAASEKPDQDIMDGRNSIDMTIFADAKVVGD